MDKKAFLSFFLILPIVLSSGCTSVQEPGTGRAIFTITDAAANMSSITSVVITVENIQVHSSEQGWVVVSSDQKAFDLLELQAEGTSALLADVQLEPGNYQQFRLDISSVIVTDSEGDHEARLPSGELRFNSGLVVEENSTSTESLDFKVAESLHLTGNGTYIFAPVLQVETRENANVEVRSNSDVQISGGNVRSSLSIGMDERGQVGENLKIPPNARINIESNGAISIGPLPGL